ncbi:NADPH oxidase 3 isoform X2 [Lepisosteus oculatus]|uniref:NADPH oxidase 3 isoform X2 n=1 Tax=Lepisosteus oculatus TaxID=7918 RepID=UPI0035F51B03
MDWVVNEGLSSFMVVLWLGLNVLLFATTFLSYSGDEAYTYTRAMLGSGLAWARASAACINLNGTAILLPVSRNFISFLRGSCVCRGRALRKQLDKNITFHRLVAYLLAAHSVVHTVAHLSNIESYHESRATGAGELLLKLSSLGETLNETFLNPVRTYNTTPIKEVMTNISGISGLVIAVVLVLMATSSTELVRRSSYELFWLTHHLFVVFFIGLVVHGTGQIVRGQTRESLSSHNVSYCRDHVDEWGNVTQCPVPRFAGNSPAVVAHPSHVLELQMRKDGFKMEPGQYVFLQCPAISRLEWHPFTLTSAPEEDYFSVHVRLKGDWTEALRAAFVDHRRSTGFPQLPRMAVDGPFGSASSDVFRYRVSVCIGAGIGVTPFASVLKSLWYKSCNPSTPIKLQKLYFFWLCRDTSAFEWFSDLLFSLETRLAGKDRLLSFHIFLTGWDEAQAYHIGLHCENHRDVVTGFREKTFYGRPDWDREFRSIADAHPRRTIGVFFCGPKPLSRIIRRMCNYHSSPDPRGVHFHFNKERLVSQALRPLESSQYETQGAR